MTVLNKFSAKIYSFFSEIKPMPLVWSSFGLIMLELLIFLIVNPVFFRDSSEYLAALDAFRLHHWDLAFPPHLPTFYTGLAGPLCQIGIEPVRALVLISGVFTALTIFPLFGLLKKMLPEKQAAWGGILFALFPDIIHCGVAPLIDSGRFFFLTASLYLIFSMPTDKISWRKLCLLGLSYGALALVRAEGICFVAITTLLYCVLLYKDLFWKKKFSFRNLGRTALFILLPVILMFLICSPRMYQMQRLTGYPCLDSRQIKPIKKITDRIIFKQKDPSTLATDTEKKAPENNRWKKRYWKNFFSSLNILYLPFSLLGLLLLLCRKKMTIYHWLMLLTMLLNSVLHYGLQAAAGRYFLANIIFLLPFTITGYTVVFEEAKKKSQLLAALGCAIAVSIAAIEVARSMATLDSGNAKDFRKAKNVFHNGGPLASICNSGCQYPTVLLLGSDYGLGYYAEVNLVQYSNYPMGLADEKTIDDLLTDGVNKKYLKHCLEKNIPDHLYFDAVATCKQSLPELPNSKYILQEQPFPQQNRLKLWKIIRINKK